MPKRVTWEDLKGADAELLDSEGQRRTWARCWRRVTGKAQRCMEAACARGWQMLCPVVFTPRPRASNQPAERPMKSKGQILGYLWKLCAGVDMTPSELSKIQNWRRRLFFIEEVDRGLAMLYVSEKSDGSTALGSMIRGAGKRGLAAGLEELEELPGALLAPVDSEVEYRMLNSLKQYEIAFFGSNAMTITALPEQLFPLALNWKDTSGAPQRLVIATSKETDRRAWKVCIRNLCLQDGMHRKAIGWSNGKCSTTGLLLYELGGLTERELEQLRAAGPVRANLRTVLHERGEESSRGFIIRSKTRRIDTEHRKCTLITVPGHRDFVKNVFAGAQQADAAILVVPADETFPSAIAGGFDGPGQSRHHAQILSAMGVKQLCVVVNKMDSAAARFSQERFEEISQEVRKMLLRSGWPRAAVDTQIPIVPISAWTGANFMAKSEDMPWWTGQELTSHKGDTVHVDTLYDVLNSFFEPPERLVDLPLRMVVSEAFKVELGHVVVGRLEHGALKVGDAVSFRPGAVGGEVQEITRFREPLVAASAGQIVAARMHLADGDRPRYGDVMVGAADCTLQAVQSFTAEVLVLDWPGEIRVGYCPLVFARGGKVPCRLSQLTRRTARDGTEEEHPQTLQARDVAECTFVPRMPFLCEAFRSCESFGRLIFMDGNQMIAVGKVLRCETHEDKDKGGKKK